MEITLLCKICSAPATSDQFEINDIVTCEKCWETK